MCDKWNHKSRIEDDKCLGNSHLATVIDQQDYSVVPCLVDRSRFCDDATMVICWSMFGVESPRQGGNGGLWNSPKGANQSTACWDDLLVGRDRGIIIIEGEIERGRPVSGPFVMSIERNEPGK